MTSLKLRPLGPPSFYTTSSATSLKMHCAHLRAGGFVFVCSFTSNEATCLPLVARQRVSLRGQCARGSVGAGGRDGSGVSIEKNPVRTISVGKTLGLHPYVGTLAPSTQVPWETSVAESSGVAAHPVDTVCWFRVLRQGSLLVGTLWRGGHCDCHFGVL